MLADPEIAIVINLTVPLAHAEISHRAVEAGKHVYSEKPFAATFAEARELAAAAAAKGVRIGSAPDTFLGAGHQAARGGRSTRAGSAASSAGPSASPAPAWRAGTPTRPSSSSAAAGRCSTSAAIRSPSSSIAWARSRASWRTPRAAQATRTVTSEPRRGEVIEVEVPTTVNGVLAFANGANVGVTVSWDIWKHARLPIELYGTEGSLLNPDPNFFGGPMRVSARNGDWQELPIDAHPFGLPNRKTMPGATSPITGWWACSTWPAPSPPAGRTGPTAIWHCMCWRSGSARAPSVEGRRIRIETICERPEPVPLGEDEEVFMAAG